MQGGDERHTVSLLHFILPLALQLPISIIDQHEHPWSTAQGEDNAALVGQMGKTQPALHGPVLHEQLWALLQVCPENVHDQPIQSKGLSTQWDFKGQILLVIKQPLQAPTAEIGLA